MTWSIESAIFRAQSAVAVAVQCVWDGLVGLERVTRPPRLGHDVDVPIPGCPNASDCRDYGCTGDCSEATDAPGFEDAASEPRPPGFYTMMDPEWADLHYGFPYPPTDKEHHIASDGGEWVFNNLGGEEWDAITYPPSGDPYMKIKRREREAAQPLAEWEQELRDAYQAPNPTEPSLSDDELVAVRGLIQERYETSAVVPRNGPAEHPAGGLTHSPESPQPAPQLDWHGWAEPAICEALTGHQYSLPLRQCKCQMGGDPFVPAMDEQEWREHVAPLIADRIGCDPARAIAALHNHKPK